MKIDDKFLTDEFIYSLIQLGAQMPGKRKEIRQIVKKLTDLKKESTDE